MEYIKRSIEKPIAEASLKYPVVALTGARGIGKTTVLKRMCEGTHRSYIPLGDIRARVLAKTNPEEFLNAYKPPVFIDDIQYAPELAEYINKKAVLSLKPGDIWLAGTYLEGEFLAGVKVFKLSALSQAELAGDITGPISVNLYDLQIRGEHRKEANTKELFDRIIMGLMPQNAKDNINQNEFYSNYVSEIERDVKEMYPALKFLQFYMFLTALVKNCAEILNITEIAFSAGINNKQTKEWLSILERLGIVYLLKPFESNAMSRLVKTQKLYFYDTGLLCYLANIKTAKELDESILSDAIIQNYAVSEVTKTYINAGLEPPVYYYKDKDTKQIDLILKRGNTLHPIAINKTKTPGTEHTKNFHLPEKSQLNVGKGAVICLRPTVGAIDRDNYIIPIWVI